MSPGKAVAMLSRCQSRMLYARSDNEATPSAKATVLTVFMKPRSAHDTSSAGSEKLNSPKAPALNPAAIRHNMYTVWLGAVTGDAAKMLKNVTPMTLIMTTERRPRWSAIAPPTRLPTNRPAMKTDWTRSALYAFPHTRLH